jgi:hypothetical protein
MSILAHADAMQHHFLRCILPHFPSGHDRNGPVHSDFHIWNVHCSTRSMHLDTICSMGLPRHDGDSPLELHLHLSRPWRLPFHQTSSFSPLTLHLLCLPLLNNIVNGLPILNNEINLINNHYHHALSCLASHMQKQMMMKGTRR